MIFVDQWDWPQPPLDVTIILYLYLWETSAESNGGVVTGPFLGGNFSFSFFFKCSGPQTTLPPLPFVSFSRFPDYFFTSHRVTSGAENTLFHYLSWDSFHGIVVCPRDGDTPSPGATVHAEVVSTFHKTCLSMRRLFSSYYKQVSCK